MVHASIFVQLKRLKLETKKSKALIRNPVSSVTFDFYTWWFIAFFHNKFLKTFSLLFQATKSTEGHFSVESKEGKGTRVTADFKYSHIDRQPLGDITGTIISLIAGVPDVDFVYSHQNGDLIYTLDTREIRRELEDIPINNTEVLRFIRTNIEEGLKKIEASD